MDTGGVYSVASRSRFIARSASVLRRAVVLSALVRGFARSAKGGARVGRLSGGRDLRWRRSRREVRVHRIRAAGRREVRQHEGLWVGSPARAVLEVAAVGTKDELIAVIDQGLALRRFTAGELKAVLERHRGRRGAGRLAGFDVLRPTRWHVVYEPVRVAVLLAQALAA